MPPSHSAKIFVQENFDPVRSRHGAAWEGDDRQGNGAAGRSSAAFLISH